MRACLALSALLLSGCATGMEAHDNDLARGRIVVDVQPYPVVRDWCRPLLNNTDSMGCASRRDDPTDVAEPMYVDGRVVIPAGARCYILVSPSIDLSGHELARCEGGATYVSLPVVSHEAKK